MAGVREIPVTMTNKLCKETLTETIYSVTAQSQVEKAAPVILDLPLILHWFNIYISFDLMASVFIIYPSFMLS